MLDADWSLNAGNWQWLSASAFFHQYFRVYSPIAFGKKTDPNGDYIRKYLPVLKDMPAKYIFEPWMAPPEVQQRAKCVVGKDYPKPIVDHNIISKTNINRMKLAYEASKIIDVKVDESESMEVGSDTSEDSKKAKTSVAAKKTTKTEKPPVGKGKTTIDKFFKTKTSPDSQPPSKKPKN